MSTISGYLDKKEIARRFSVDQSTVNRWITKGYLSAVKVGPVWLVPEKELQGFRPPKAGNPNFRKEIL